MMSVQYFRQAFRNFRKHTLFTLINVSGLAIGISAALVIYLIVQHEFTYEAGLKDKERIYRVVSKMEISDMTIRNSGVPVPTPAALRAEGTGLDAVTHFFSRSGMKLSIPQSGETAPVVYRKTKDILFADTDYFRIIPYEWLAGPGPNAMKEPFQVVLTEERAQKYFPGMAFADILGKVIVYDDSIRTSVAGIVKKISWPTDLHFLEFISLPTMTATGLRNHWSWEEWGSINSSSQMLVKLLPGTDPKQVEKQLATIRDRHRTKDKDQPEDDLQHFLQGVADIHFNPEYDAFEQRQASRKVLNGLMAVALFLLLLGCINFINLSTAQAGLRAREIGIRKTLGSSRRHLILQYLSETAILTILAAALSIILSPWLLKVFRDFIPPGVNFNSLNQPHVWLFMVILTIVVTLAAGIYPALVLTKFKPATIMKNQVQAGSGHTRKSGLRKTLTVMQFVIAQFLLIATLTLSKQIHYSLNKDLGYQREAIVHFSAPWNFFSEVKDERRKVLLEKLKQVPEIQSVSLGGSAPADFSYSTSSMSFVRGETKKETMVEVKHGDSGYFQIYGLKLMAGRHLRPNDTTAEYIINETYARFLGFKQNADAVGILIGDSRKIPVVGIVRDFHQRSTHDLIKPLAYSSAMDNSYQVHMLLASKDADPGTWERALRKTESAFKELYPEDEFQYQFFDEGVASFYAAEQKMIRLMRWATGLCIFISCLGLLGLVIFTTHTRTKEIGVRKVLGASVTQIVSLLSRDFIVLITIAFLLAAPAGGLFMHNWLQDYAYRTEMSWWIFLLCGFGTLFVALIILAARTVKAASANPVESLRSE